jgi:hypothetical protein
MADRTASIGTIFLHRCTLDLALRAVDLSQLLSHIFLAVSNVQTHFASFRDRGPPRLRGCFAFRTGDLHRHFAAQWIPGLLSLILSLEPFP